MSYSQLLKNYEEVPVYRLLVANEVNDILVEEGLIEKYRNEYEIVCDYVYEYISNSQMSVNELVNLIRCAEHADYSIIKLILNERWEEADEIIYKIM